MRTLIRLDRVMLAIGVLVSSLLMASASMAQSTTAGSRAADWGKVLEAARKEGKVVLYYAMVPPVFDRLREDFGKAIPGISVEGTRIGGMPLPVRVDLEQKSGADGADLAILAEVLWAEERANAGAFNVPSGPASSAWPQAYMLAGRLPVLGIEPFVLAYNTNLIKTEIKGFEDLLRPELKGKIGISEPRTTTSVAWFDWIEKTYGTGYLTKLAAQNPRSYTGTVPGTQAVVSGEIAVTAYSLAAVATPLIAQGAPIKIVITKPSTGTQYVGALFGHAKRPNAAHVFLDYVMSTRGQAIWHGTGGTASALPGIPGSVDAKTVVAYDAKAYTADAVKAYTIKINNIFERR